VYTQIAVEIDRHVASIHSHFAQVMEQGACHGLAGDPIRPISVTRVATRDIASRQRGNRLPLCGRVLQSRSCRTAAFACIGTHPSGLSVRELALRWHADC
jgi:hypothetical protein